MHIMGLYMWNKTHSDIETSQSSGSATYFQNIIAVLMGWSHIQYAAFQQINKVFQSATVAQWIRHRPPKPVDLNLSEF